MTTSSNLATRLTYLNQLEAAMEEGGLQQRLHAGDPHPTGRWRGERDGGVYGGAG